MEPSDTGARLSPEKQAKQGKTILFTIKFWTGTFCCLCTYSEDSPSNTCDKNESNSVLTFGETSICVSTV